MIYSTLLSTLSLILREVQVVAVYFFSFSECYSFCFPQPIVQDIVVCLLHLHLNPDSRQ